MSNLFPDFSANSSDVTSEAPRKPAAKSRQKNPLVQPFVKWVGGKRQLLPEIRAAFPDYKGRYFEPFIGGGAVFFDHAPKRAVVGDLNGELINCYEVIRDYPEELLEDVKRHENTSDYFYALCQQQSETHAAHLPPIQRASNFLFVCNIAPRVPIRRFSKAEIEALDEGIEVEDPAVETFFNTNQIADESIVRAVSRFLRRLSPLFLTGHRDTILNGMRRGDFVYIQPNWLGSQAEHEQIAAQCQQLQEQGVLFLLALPDSQRARSVYANSSYFWKPIPLITNETLLTSDISFARHLLVTNYPLSR